MMIDNFYTETDKSHFYIGLISEVNKKNSVIQVENLSWLSHRKIKQEILIPNTINYYVVIDSVKGLFFGEVFQSKVSNSDSVHKSLNNGITESVYPEMSINIVGIMKRADDIFQLPGFNTVGITDKVYIASKTCVEKYFKSIEVTQNNEKPLSPFSKSSSQEDQDILLKPSTLFDRHLITLGTTNSGKSTSALSILDKLIKDEKKVLIIDPTGEYKDSFTKDEFTKLKLGNNTIIPVGELSIQQWAMLFETNDATQPAVLADAINSLRYQKKNATPGPYIKVGKVVDQVRADMCSLTLLDKDFELSDLTTQISEETNQIDTRTSKYKKTDFHFNSVQWLIQKVEYKFNNTSFLNFFSNEHNKKNLMTEIEEFLITKNSNLYIDSSAIGTADEVGGVIIDLISNYIIGRNTIKPFVLFIDEVHRYTKRENSEDNYYTGLTLIAREGRKKGVFLFLTTQNPQDVSKILLGQVGSVLIHRLTHYDEIKSIQNYLTESSILSVRKLNQGEAILTSINLLQDIHMNIKKCKRTHANQTPLL